MNKDYLIDKEWDLLDKQINESVTPVAQPKRRATVWIGDELMTMLAELVAGGRNQVTIVTPIIEGLLKTQEQIEINLVLDDEEKQ